VTSRTTIGALALIAAAVVACGGAQRTAVEPSRHDAIVTIECPVPDATVWVNGHEVRQVRELAGGMALSPGTHRIEVHHDDYHAAYLEVTVTADEHKTIEVDLAPILD